MINAIAPWFGSKRKLAHAIVNALGPHHTYYEPFCGGLAVLMAKPPCRMETVCDLHGDLTHLARTIADPKSGAALYRRLRRTLCCQEIHRDAKEQIARPFEPTIDRAYWFFILSWLSRNGAIGSNAGNNFCVRYTHGGGSPGTRFVSAIESIPFFMRRLRPVIILSTCGITVTERIEDADGVAVYLDPPYLEKGAKYIHDFTSADHQRLAAAARRFVKTRVVVSYYDHPRLDELYPDFQKIALDHTKAMSHQNGRRGALKAPEVLLINGLPINGNAAPPPDLWSQPETTTK